MKEEYKDIVASIAFDVKALNSDFKFNLALQILYAGLTLDKYIDFAAGKYGQSRSRLDVLHTLIIHGGALKPSDLSRMLLRSRQTITGTIDGLERDGLVQRELIGYDRRTRKVLITEKGLGLVRDSLPRTQEIVDKTITELSQEKMVELTAILAQIRKRLHTVMKLEKANNIKPFSH